MGQGLPGPTRAWESRQRDPPGGAQGLGMDTATGQQLPSQVPVGWSGAYRVLTVMTQVVSPNEECDQLPVFLQVDFLRAWRSAV